MLGLRGRFPKTPEWGVNQSIRALPFFRYVFTLPFPDCLEVTAELIPHHKHVVGCDLLLTRLWLHPKISYCCFKTANVEKKNSEVEGERLSTLIPIRGGEGTPGEFLPHASLLFSTEAQA